MGQALSLATGKGGTAERRSFLRDPLAILLAGVWLLLAGYVAWWLSGQGDAQVADKYSGLIGLPAGGVLALCVIRLRRSQGVDRPSRRMWAVIILGLASYATGAFLHMAALSAPTVAFLGPIGISFEIAAYPIAWFGLALLVEHGRPRSDIILIGLDVAIVAWSASMLGWHLFLYPIASENGASLASAFSVALFPGLDLATMFALAAATSRTPRFSTAAAMVVLNVAIGSLMLGDIVSGVETLRGDYRPGGLSGLFFSGTWVAFALAAYLQWRLPQRERTVGRNRARAGGQPWLAYVALAIAFVVPTLGSWNDRQLLQEHLAATGLLMGLVAARLAVTAWDSSRLAAAERERLAVAVEQAAEAIVTTDREGRVTYVNPAFARITGFTSETMVGHAMSMMHWGEDPTRRAEWAKVLTGGGTWEGRVEGRRPDGVPFVVALTVAPLRDRDGLVAGAVGVARDIAREQELETELAQSQRMEAIGRLAGGVAHDFNNILTVINGFSELAAAELPRDHPVAEDIAEIVKASDRAAGLTRALLAFSRRQVMQAQTLDLNEVVSGMLPMLEVLMGQDIEVLIKPAEKLGLTVADRAQLEQVILNLATNARDAMPQGGRLTIATRNANLTEKYVAAHVGARVGQYVALVVSDTGAGMTREVRDHAFEPFFTTKERGKGTGLGLSTVIGVVQQSGGSIELDTKPGAGAEFSIYLPRVHGPLPAAEAAPVEVQARGGSETILVAEDERALRVFVERILRQAGYRVVSCANGAEALEQVRREAGIDLLFTDIVMPGMDGPELARRVGRLRPGLPVVFASGYAEQALLHGLADGEKPYLAKPYTAENLLARIRETLDARTSKAGGAGQA